jgi:outer membrane receptor protein involved in Fe transport
LPEAGASFANLRGLNPTYGTRTLTLVNGRGFVPTSVCGQVDLNLIPSLMIGRVETVTGGASAAYGRDAVAGVVNIILDDQLQGFQGQVDYGQTGRGDGKSFHGAAAWGTDISDRGHFVIGGEYQRNRGIDHCAEARSWCGEGWTVVINASAIELGKVNKLTNVSGYNISGSSGYRQPNHVIGCDGGLVYNSVFGTVRNSFSANYPTFRPPLAAMDKVFTPDGTGIMDYDPGMFAPIFVGGLALGGDNDSTYADQYIRTPVERYTTYAAAKYELTDAIGLYGELTYGKRMANSRALTAVTRSTMVIKPDNAFLPAELVTLLNGQPFSLGKDVHEELSNLISVEARHSAGSWGPKGISTTSMARTSERPKYGIHALTMRCPWPSMR